MIENDNAIFMEQEEYEEYLKQKKAELDSQLQQVRLDNPKKIADVSMYELNQNIVAQMKNLTSTEIKKRMKLIRSWLYHDSDIYYALICWDFHYITLFHCPNDNYDEQIQQMQEILTSLGTIKAIDPHHMGHAMDMHHIEDNIEDVDAFEIWIQLADEDVPKMFMLFPYGGGVVEI